jgi:hypothetical protein
MKRINLIICLAFLLGITLSACGSRERCDTYYEWDSTGYYYGSKSCYEYDPYYYKSSPGEYENTW